MFNKCVACGRDGAKILSDEKLFCNECASKFGTCKMCIHGRKCEFSTNLAPIPKMVTQRVRQKTEAGYVEQIVQRPNPQRIKVFCVDNKCTCYDQEFSWCRCQFGTCENYVEIEF